MPVMDEERSLERIQGIRQDAGVIVASGCVGTETGHVSETGGAHEVPQKPYRMDRLSAAIRNVLDA
jgi:DNA-binding NtrC family response regulator